MLLQGELERSLKELGLGDGMDVLAHVSMRSIGPIEGGADTLIAAIMNTVGPQATLIAPTFTPQLRDPAEWRFPPELPEQLEQMRNATSRFDPVTTPAGQPSAGVFAEQLRLLPGSCRSNHPTHSFAAFGRSAQQYTDGTPYHFPLGSESVPARLHNKDGRVLLIGVTMDVNISLHLAEVWANVPYIHRSARIKNSAGEYSVMRGSVECQDGFWKIEPLLRQARLIKRGTIGNATALLMRQTEQISMAIAMLQGKSDSLLCDSEECRFCRLARRFTGEQVTNLDC
jgi:aminoglycoside 3-N-acetyltransferase